MDGLRLLVVWASCNMPYLYNVSYAMKHAIASSRIRIALIIAFVSLGALLSSQPAPRERVGPLPDGSYCLRTACAWTSAVS